MTNLIIKLILLPFLLLLLLFKAVAALISRDQCIHIPKIVEKLAAERAPLGTAINELTFDRVLAYASQKATVTAIQHNFFEFEIDVGGKLYHAGITRAPDGSNCAIFRCRPATRSHPEAASPLVQVDSESRNESVELTKVVNGLNAIFDRHAEEIKW